MGLYYIKYYRVIQEYVYHYIIEVKFSDKNLINHK